MNRIATTLITLTASAFFCQSSEAADAGTDSLNSRMIAIEARLESLEKALLGQTGSYSYQDQATIDATNGKTADSTPQTTSSKTYVIQDGDTLGSIARKHGVERTELLSANRLSEGQPIYIGETLLIPGAAAPEGPPAPEKKQEVVKTNTPPPAKEKSVVVGETKKSASSHTVVKGDTLTSIARKYSTQVPALKSANGLKNDVLILGQKLTIPAAGTKVAKNDSAPAPSNKQDAEYEYENPLLKNSETYGYYTVRKGDNLYALARDFFSNMSELQRLNRLGNSTLIYPGDELIVPTSKYNAYHGAGDVAQR